MTEKRVVLVTGAAGEWGGRVAAALAANPDLHVIGMDHALLKSEIKGLDFIQADIRNPLLVELFREEQVDTLCHLAFDEGVRPSEAAFDLNVIGTMKALGAAAEAGVRKVVLKSSTMVYGAAATNSAFLREDHALHGSKSYGYVRDLIEIESFCNGFASSNPNMVLSVLRFAQIVGPKADTPMTRFLRDEEALVLFGFDPMMQAIHETDVTGALVHVVMNDVRGVFNVAAEGVLPLWRMLGLASKVPVPAFHPLAYLSVSLFGPRVAPLDLDYLRYPCVADLAHMREKFGYTPLYTAEEALREFAAQQRLREYLPESAARAYDQDRLRDTIERRKRMRTQAEKTRAATDAAPAIKRARTRKNGNARPPRPEAAPEPYLPAADALATAQENGVNENGENENG